MYKTQGLLIATVPFTLLSIFLLVYSMILTTNKLSDTSEISQFQQDHSPYFEQKSKVILMVIDGLRFDYFYNETGVHHPDNWSRNQYHKFLKFLEKSPEKSVALKIYVDPPTRTSNRIPCIVSGNIPQKLIGLQAFGGLPINEDTVLHQLIKTGKRKAYFAGDPLWYEYFGKDLNFVPETNGFDIKDTEVDNVPIEYIRNVAKKNDFDLLIGHMLGVDHMSHLKGLLDPSIAKAKKKIENFLLELIEGMDDETTLIVTGDHGAVMSGEHGLDSYEETYIPLIAYNKKGFQKYKQEDMKEVMKSLQEKKVVDQINLAPTLAMLLGVPVPFSNLGQMVDDLYPAGKIPEVQTCPENSFAVQAFYNNYATSMQILNYLFEKDAKTKLKIFEQKDLDAAKASFQEIENDYKAIQVLMNDPTKCQETHQMLIDTIIKCQKFAPQVYNTVKNANTFDLVIGGVALLGLLLVMLAFVLTIQYIYVAGYQEKNSILTVPKLLKNAKSLIPLVIINIIGSFAAWSYNDSYAYPLAACLILTEFWFCASIAISFINLQDKIPFAKINNNQEEVVTVNTVQVDQSNVESPEIKAPIDEVTQENISLVTGGRTQNIGASLGSKFFLLQSPLQTSVTLVILAYLLYLLHLKNFFTLHVHYLTPSVSFVSLLLIAYLLTKFFPRYFYPIMTIGIVSCLAIRYTHAFSMKNLKLKHWLGLLLVAEWSLREIYYMRKNLKATKLLSTIQLICLGTLVYYQVSKVHNTHFIDITLPRIIWGLLSSSIITGYIQKIEGTTRKRNIQFCLVMFMMLLRRPKEMVYFGNLIQIMSILNRLFVKADVKNYLYSVFMGFVSYIGLFYLLLTDYFVIMNFTPAFIGLNDFNIVICPLFYLIYLMSSFILGMIFVSHYNQALGSTEKAKLPEKESEGIVDVIGETRLQKKRNIFLVALFYGLVLFSASLKVYFLRTTHLGFAFEKFFIDTVFYLFIVGCGYFMLNN